MYTNPMDIINSIKWYHIVIVLLTIGLIFTIWKQKPTPQPENFSETPQTPKAEIILYYAMWCGYSRQFLPEWERFEEYSKKNLPQFRVSKVRCEDGNEATCLQKGIEGYPTVVCYTDDGKEYKFESEQRNFDGLIKFAQSIK